MLEKIVINLSSLLENRYQVWESFRDTFSCPRNLDVEKFLKQSAERFENTHNSRTYLILDQNNINSGILAYFAITFKEIELPDDISKTKVKTLDGISKNAKTIKGYLIGQIGKNDFPNNPIKLPDIFDEIYTIIDKVQKLVGGRIIFLECEDNEKLINLYKKNDFEVLSKKEYVQMYKPINLD